jgi:hypothetical protein
MVVALATLASCGNQGGRPYSNQLKGLSDPDPFNRAFAASFLGDQGPDALGCLPELEVALSDSDSRVRVEAAYAIYRIDPKQSASVVPIIARELCNEETLVRRNAIMHLGSIGANAKSATVGLTRILDSNGESYERFLAASALAHIDKDCHLLVLRHLEGGLNDPDRYSRQVCAEGLAALGAHAKHAVPALRALLRDENENVSTSAAIALRAIGDGP